MKTIQIKGLVHRNKKWIEVDGKTYVVQDSDSKKHRKDGMNLLTLAEFPMKDYDAAIDEICEVVSKKANIKEIIKQSLYDVPLKDIFEIQKELKKEKPVIRNNVGCVSMSIGKIRIPIRD